MKPATHWGALAVTLALAFAPPTLAETRLANGHDWTKSSATERRAYIAGISNTISAGAAWDAKHLPAGQRSFMGEAQKALSPSSIDDAIGVIDTWYKTNPTQLDKPVLSVMWLQIAKPRLAQAQ